MVNDLLSAVEPLFYLIYIVVILITGILVSLIAKKIKIPNILFLLLGGIILGHLEYHGEPLISFPAVFLTAISTVALVMIVFDAGSKFNIKEFDTLAWRVIKLSSIFFLLTFVFLSLATKFMFKVSIWHALIFSSLMAGTSPSVILMMFGEVKTRVLEILKIESIINTPLTVLFPFMILELSYKLTDVTLSKFDVILEQFEPFIVLFIAGVGTGVLMGLIGSRIMKNTYLRNISPLALITMALLTYVLSEKLGGNGVLAVTIMGLFYGNLYIKEKVKLFEFSEVFTNSMEILVFVLIGLVVKFPLTRAFIYKSLFLFSIYLIIRFVSINISFKKDGLKIREKLFMTLNVQKGIAVAVVVFFLSTIPALTSIMHLTLAFMLYSIILSTLFLPFTKKILNLDIKKKEEVQKEKKEG